MPVGQPDGHDLWQALRSRDDDVPASSPRVPDARRGARPPLGVAGSSAPTRLTARSRPRSACLRRWSSCEFPPRPGRPARRAIAPRRRRYLHINKITGTIPPEIGQLTALKDLRVPPASPTPGAPRDRSSTAQVAQQQQDHRPDPARDRPAHGADVAEVARDRAVDLVVVEVPATPRGGRAPRRVSGTRGHLAGTPAP